MTYIKKNIRGLFKGRSYFVLFKKILKIIILKKKLCPFLKEAKCRLKLRKPEAGALSLSYSTDENQNN